MKMSRVRDVILVCLELSITYYNRPGYPGHIGERTDDNGISFYKTKADGR